MIAKTWSQSLPKTHKKDAPFRPILSMVGSAQHELAKSLSSTMQPVLDLYSSNCTKDSFSFAQKVQQLEFNPDYSFLCSHDISSLFTNVPLDETLQICADTLYNGHLPPPQFLKVIFIELMNVATKSVEFSFNNVMYKQTGGEAMGSPLGPALANNFVGYTKISFLSPLKNCSSILVTLMIHSLFSDQKQKQTNFLLPSTPYTQP